MSRPRAIDVHAHFSPEGFLAAVETWGGRFGAGEPREGAAGRHPPGRAGPGIAYLDADEFRECWGRDALTLAAVIKRIGRIETK